MRTVIDTFCDAEVNTFEEAGVMPWLTCLAEPGHDGDHRSICHAPCINCGGVDLHYEDCPGEPEFFDCILVIRFNDEGEYWCEDWK